MTTQPPRRYAGLVIAIVVAALIIGAAIYASSFTGRTSTITKTSTVTATTISSTTSTAGGVETTSTIQIPTSLASAQDTSLGLTLGLRISANSTGALSISANEANLLNRVNNVTTADNWPYPNTGSYPCGDWDYFPIEYAVLQGHYDTSNYTSGSALTLYDTADVYTCPTIMAPIPYLLFAPLSDNVSRWLASAGYSYTGYWTGSGTTASFHQFSPGTYTVLQRTNGGMSSFFTLP